MTILGITLSAAILWLILAIILCIIEALTMGLTTIWFAGGAAAAAVSAAAGLSLLPQVIIFLAVSCLLLAFTRPLARKKLNASTQKTNADALIGREGLVTESIVPPAPGQVKIDGLVWTAASADGETAIEKGNAVTILDIRGVKLLVAPSEKQR